VRVGAAGDEAVAALEQRLRQRVGVGPDLLLVLAEGLGAGDREADRLGGFPTWEA
jgi:hypothetical protein